ncbi:MAG: phenylacetate--CoA ligase family protein, partial [Gammaproteobacteria bacterium]
MTQPPRTAALPPIVGAGADFVFPALPHASATGMLAVLQLLEQTEWLAPAAIAAHQRDQLAVLLAHARRTTPHYESVLAGLDLAGVLTADAFEALPLLSRATLREAYDALRSRRVPPAHGALVRYTTTGSTGVPLAVLGSGLTDLWYRALGLREHLWHGRDFAATLAVIKTRIDDARHPGWGSATAGVFATGPSVSLNARHPIAAQARWLAAADPDYLLAAATNLDGLARYCLRHGIALPRLREVRSYAEMLRPDTRALCRAAWDVPLVDTYSAEEVGVIALQCPAHQHYHVMAESVLVEVLDDTGAPCPPGTVGRVVVTALHNFAMPLVRYELGDYAEVGPPCDCGRGLPVLTRIVGRRRNLLHRPDGSTHWPTFSATVWSWLPAIEQLQLVQDRPDHVRVRLVTTRALDAAEEAGLAARLDACFGYPFAYTFERVAAL